MTTLYEWYLKNYKQMEQSTLYYKNAWAKQYQFIRDRISYCMGLPPKTVEVVSTHRSKSTELPVYELKLPYCIIELRGNYHDWNCSIQFCDAVALDSIPGLTNFISGNYLYFQGMSRRYPPYAAGRVDTQHSFSCNTDYDLYAALRCIHKHFNC